MGYKFNVFTGNFDIDSTGAGTPTNSFETIQTDTGTSPVADSPTDTLTLTGDGTISTVGNSGTDTITLSLGTVPVSKGGTNITTYTIGDILYSSAMNVLSKLPIGTNGQVLKISGGLPSWGTDTDTGITQLIGDVTAGPGSGSQVATIANDAVTFAKMQNIATNKILGRSTAGTGDVEELTIGTGLLLSGGTLTSTGTPASPDKSVQFNNAGVFDGDQYFNWDDTLKFVGVQNTSPGAPIHVNGLLGGSVAAPASATATLVLDTQVDAPATYTTSQINPPTAPTSVATSIISYIEASTGGSGSDTPDGSSVFVAQGQTWTYKVYSYRAYSGLKICNPNFSQIDVTDTFNDSSLVRVDISGWSTPTNYDGFMLVRTDNIGSPEASLDISTATSYGDLGFVNTDAYVISQYVANGSTNITPTVYQYKTISATNYNSAGVTSSPQTDDNSGQYYFTNTTWDTAVNDGFQVVTYNGAPYDVTTATSFVDYGQTVGSISLYQLFTSVAFAPLNTSLTDASGVSFNFNYSGGSLLADGSSWEIRIYEYRNHPVTGVKYYTNTPASSGSFTDDNSSNFFYIDGGYTVGDGDGAVVILYQNGSPVWGYDNGVSATYQVNGNEVTPDVSNLITAYTGLARTFNAFGKENSPTVKYSSTSTLSNFTDNNSGYYLIKHEYTGIGNADEIKTQQVITGYTTISVQVTATPTFQFVSTSGDNVFTPNTIGFLANGTNLNRDFRVYSTKVIGGTTVFSATYALGSTVDPNDGNYYSISLTHPLVSGATYKTGLSINGGGFTYRTYSTVPQVNRADQTWANSSTTITPTVGPTMAIIAERATSTYQSDIATIVVRTANGGSVQNAAIDFEYGGGAQTARIGTNSVGSFQINSYDGAISMAPLNGTIHTKIDGTGGTIFNVQGSSSYRFKIKGSFFSDLLYADSQIDTVYIGSNSGFTYDPTSSLAIRPGGTDLAFTINQSGGYVATALAMQLKDDSSTISYVLDNSGRIGVRTSSVGQANLNIGSAGGSGVQLQFQSNAALNSGVVRGISTQGNDIYWSGDGSAWRKFNTGLDSSTSTQFWRSDASGNAIADNVLSVVSGVVLQASIQILAQQGLALSSGKDLVMGNNSKITGNIGYSYLARTTALTLNVTHYCVDCTSGTFALTLPTAVSISGRQYVMKNSGTGVITINTTSSQTIDGQASGAITLNQYDSITVMSNNANWIIL